MPQPSPIADYAGELARELAFDGHLSRRVQQEVEDHLWAAAEDAGDASAEAQRRAIDRFGDPRTIAAQYAAGALFRQTKRMGAVGVLVILGVYVLMKTRSAWYDLMQWTIGDDLRAAFQVAVPVIRYAFMAAALLGIASWICIALRRTPLRLHGVHRRQLRLAQGLGAAAALAVTISLVCEVALTWIRLAGTPWSLQLLIPLGSMAGEIALAGLLAAQLVAAIRGTSLAPSAS